MPRLLVMSERVVHRLDRAGYLSALAARRELAAAASANFWVFEQRDEDGHFLEFIEAGSAESLDAAIEQIAEYEESGALVVWKEVGGLN